MKNQFNVMSSIGVICLFCILSASCAKAPVDVTNEIKKANEVFMTAVRNADINTLTGLYTSDAKLMPNNGQVVEGVEAITGFWNSTMKMGIKKVNFETVSAQKIGDMAVEEGKYTLYVEGDHVVDQGKYLVTWKREDGKWKVQRDIWNVSTPAPQQRAMANDTVMVIINHVKPDKVAQFEEFNTKYLFPAGAEFNPQAKSTIRVEKPVYQNSDGTYTYMYIMDPYKGMYNYEMYANLEAKYGKEKASEYEKMYAECLKDGKANSFVTVETAW